MQNNSSPAATPGAFAWARAILAKCGRLSPKEIAVLLEHNPTQPLPDDLRGAAINSLTKNGPRGRKRVMGTAASDFIIADAFSLYQTKRAEYVAAKAAARREAKSCGERLEQARLSPSERALDYVLKEMRKDLGNIGRRRLLNLFSAWKRVRDWEPPED